MLETATSGMKHYRPWPSLIDTTEYTHVASLWYFWFIFTEKQNANHRSNAGENFCKVKKVNILPWVLYRFHFHISSYSSTNTTNNAVFEVRTQGFWRFEYSWNVTVHCLVSVPEIPRELQPLMMALPSSEISKTTHHTTQCNIPETGQSTHHIKRLSWTQHNLISGTRSTIHSSHHQKQYCNQNISDSIIIKCTSQKWCEVVYWIHLAHDGDQW
jgi:hypothetical protein